MGGEGRLVGPLDGTQPLQNRGVIGIVIQLFQGLGVQLLGQAVSTYRPLGRDRLRLCCAPDNGIAQRFYQKYGFVKMGEEPGARGPLDVLEKYIGFEAKES